MPLKDAIATVTNRNAFYRDGYRLLLKLSLLQTGAIGLLAAVIVGLALTSTTRQIYFATTTDGRIIPLVSVSEPYRSQAEVVSWAAKTAQEVAHAPHRFGSGAVR